MFGRTRGAIAGLTLVLALAGCSNGGGSDSGGTSGGGGSKGGARPVDSPLNPSQVAQAIPGKIAVPQGWHGGEPLVAQGGEAQEQCQLTARWSCAGVTAQASSEYSHGADVDAGFTVIAYDSVDNAKVGLKTLVADNHDEGGLKPLTVEAGADESDAYSKEEFGVVAMRVGTVVAMVVGQSLPKDHDLTSFAKFQVERITTAATGKNPDA
ncbi:hypothetical protein [Streptomyces griseosporeus]|uniref:hypothetical protein n=1 Tax=Streptomyces griseosporeus TaxID=1910 RepID=UPI0037026279